jgi:protein involved in polysaccharide export with SLBB domain
MLVGVGGHTTKADLNRVQFVREGKLYYINLAKIISQQSGAEQDIILENGDRILLCIYLRTISLLLNI